MRGEGRGQSGLRSHLTGATPRDGRSLSGPSWALSVSVSVSVSVCLSLCLSVDLVWPGVVICNVDCNIISSSLLAVVVAVVAGSGRTTVICLSWDQPSHQPGLVWPCCTHWAWHHLHLMASSVQPGPAPPVRTPSTTSTTSIRGWAELRMSDSQICLVSGQISLVKSLVRWGEVCEGQCWGGQAEDQDSRGLETVQRREPQSWEPDLVTWLPASSLQWDLMICEGTEDGQHHHTEPFVAGRHFFKSFPHHSWFKKLFYKIFFFLSK